MNCVQIKGNLVRDPDVRVVKVGDKTTSVAHFTVAVNSYYKKANGEKGETAVFVRCQCWDTGAQTIGKYFAKGDPILLEGRLVSNDWTDKHDQKRTDLEIRVTNFEILKKREQNSPVNDPVDYNDLPAPDPAVNDTSDDEDTPF